MVHIERKLYAYNMVSSSEMEAELLLFSLSINHVDLLWWDIRNLHLSDLRWIYRWIIIWSSYSIGWSSIILGWTSAAEIIIIGILDFLLWHWLLSTDILLLLLFFLSRRRNSILLFFWIIYQAVSILLNKPFCYIGWEGIYLHRHEYYYWWMCR